MSRGSSTATNIPDIVQPMLMRNTEIARIVPALRLIFWGVLIYIFDLEWAVTRGATPDGTFSRTSVSYGLMTKASPQPGALYESGWTFDLLNNALGIILILIGLAALRRIHGGARYARALRFVTAIAVFALLHAIHGHWLYKIPPLLGEIFTLFSLLLVIALLVFCVAMRDLCRWLQLYRSGHSWFVTQMLYTALYLMPMAFLDLLSWGYRLTGSPFAFDFTYHDAAGTLLVMLVIFAFVCLPQYYLLRSTSCMAREAMELPVRETEG